MVFQQTHMIGIPVLWESDFHKWVGLLSNIYFFDYFILIKHMNWSLGQNLHSSKEIKEILGFSHFE